MNAAVGRLWSRIFKPQQKLVGRFDVLIQKIQSARNDLEKLEESMRQVSQLMEGISLVVEQHIPFYEQIERDSEHASDVLKNLKQTRLGLNNLQSWLQSLEIVRMGLDETVQFNRRNTQNALQLSWQISEIFAAVRSLDGAIMQMLLAAGQLAKPQPEGVAQTRHRGCVIAANEIAAVLQEKPTAALMAFVQDIQHEIQTSGDSMERALQTVVSEVEGLDAAIDNLKQMQASVSEDIESISMDVPQITSELSTIRQDISRISELCQNQALLMSSVSGEIDRQIVDLDGVLASTTSLKKITADLRVFPNVLNPYRDIASPVGYMVELLEKSRHAVGQIADEVRELVPPVEEQNQSSNAITSRAEEIFGRQEGVYERAGVITRVVDDMPRVCSELQFNAGLLARSLNSLAESACTLASGRMNSESFDEYLNEMMHGLQSQVMQARHLMILGKMVSAETGEDFKILEHMQQQVNQLQENTSAIHTRLQTFRRTYLEMMLDTARGIAPTMRQAENLSGFGSQAQRDWKRDLENLLANIGSVSLKARECGKRVSEAGEKLLQITSRTHTASQNMHQAAASASQLSRYCGDTLLFARDLRAFTGWEEAPLQQAESVAGSVPAYRAARFASKKQLLSILTGIGLALLCCSGLGGLLYLAARWVFPAWF